MRYSTVEIRWHDTLPMYSVDAQPFECKTHKRQINPYQRTAGNVSDGDGKLWRLATAGGDKKVRIWLAIPDPPLETSNSSVKPAAANGSSSTSAKAGPSTSSSSPAYAKPKVEYLATLDRHTLTVNVVRFSPAGHLLATAGDDAGTAGILIWKLLPHMPSKRMGDSPEDLAFEREAWQAIKVIRTKSPEVYDLAWSPDGDYILAGGTDAAAYIYRVADGACVAILSDHKDWVQGVAWDPLNQYVATQGKDRTMNVYSVDTSAPSGDVKVKLSSKNSRITVETTSSSISLSRSGSPALAEASTSASTSANAVPQLPKPRTSTHTHPMFGDEEVNPFFRRLAFSTDGSLLVAPAGITETPQATDKKGKRAALTTVDPNSGATEKDKPKSTNGKDSAMKQKKLPVGTSPTVYLFARGQLENETPVAHLPGHRTSSIAVKFNPILWDLRSKKSASAKGKEKAVDGDAMTQDSAMDVDGGSAESSKQESSGKDAMEVDGENGSMIPTEGKDAVNGSFGAEAPLLEDGIFASKKRSIYAVATHETILIYDTQQASPICMFGSLHFAAFTDLAWTSDGLTLIATSSDGYASIFTFEDGELGVSCSEQPARPVSKYEEAQLANLSATSPVKPTVLQPKPPVTAEAREQGQEAITIPGSPGDGQARPEADPAKKVKKRANLTTVPLGGGSA